MKKILFPCLCFAIGLHLAAQGVAPKRINLADQEAEAAKGISTNSNPQLEGRVMVAPGVKSKTKGVRKVVTEKEVSSTEPLFIQGATVEPPARSLSKSKMQSKIAVVVEEEELSVVAKPVVSSRPVRINLADQESAAAQPTANQRVVVDTPARSIQKYKTQAKAPVAIVEEEVPVVSKPAVSGRPVRINLADQESTSDQPIVNQRFVADSPARSNQKSKLQPKVPVAVVEQAVPVVAKPVSSNRPVRINLADQDSKSTQSVSTSSSTVDFPAHSIQKSRLKGAAPITPVVEQSAVVAPPAPSKRAARINLAEQDAAMPRSVGTSQSTLARPRTQVTSSKSLVDDTITPLQVEPELQLPVSTTSKRSSRVNLADEAVSTPALETPALINVPNKSRKPFASSAAMKASDTKISAVAIPKKEGKRRKAVNATLSKKEVSGNQLAKLLDSDASATEKAQSIAASMDLHFGFNSKALLSEESDKVLPLSEILKENQDINLRIVGHTDNVGSLKANYILGNKRAIVVKQLFEEQGVSENQLKTSSRAYLEPLVPNDVERNLAKNRRVEVKVGQPGNSDVEPSNGSNSDVTNGLAEGDERVYKTFIAHLPIEEGGRLTLISKKYYGARDFWVYIYEANKDRIANPDVIQTGTMIHVPKLPTSLIDSTNPSSLEKARRLHDLYVK